MSVDRSRNGTVASWLGLRTIRGMDHAILAVPEPIALTIRRADVAWELTTRNRLTALLSIRVVCGFLPIPHHFHDAQLRFLRRDNVLDFEAGIDAREEVDPVVPVAFFGIRHGQHADVCPSVERISITLAGSGSLRSARLPSLAFLKCGQFTWLWQENFLDEKSGSGFQGRDQCTADLLAVLVGPVVEDPPVKVHIGPFDRLLLEEIVGDKLDLALEVVGHFSGLDDLFTVLNNELEGWVLTGNLEAGHAVGTTHINDSAFLWQQGPVEAGKDMGSFKARRCLEIFHCILESLCPELVCTDLLVELTVGVKCEIECLIVSEYQKAFRLQHGRLDSIQLHLALESLATSPWHLSSAVDGSDRVVKRVMNVTGHPLELR